MKFYSLPISMLNIKQCINKGACPIQRHAISWYIQNPASMGVKFYKNDFINFFLWKWHSRFNAQISHTVQVIPRDNNRHRYKKVALVVDGEQKALSPDTGNWVKGAFNMLDHGSESPLTGSEFKLDWTKDGDDQFAQVKFIEIDYEGERFYYRRANLYRYIFFNNIIFKSFQ